MMKLFRRHLLQMWHDNTVLCTSVSVGREYCVASIHNIVRHTNTHTYAHTHAHTQLTSNCLNVAHVSTQWSVTLRFPFLLLQLRIHYSVLWSSVNVCTYICHNPQLNWEREMEMERSFSASPPLASCCWMPKKRPLADQFGASSPTRIVSELCMQYQYIHTHTHTRTHTHARTHTDLYNRTQRCTYTLSLPILSSSPHSHHVCVVWLNEWLSQAHLSCSVRCHLHVTLNGA